MDLLPLETNKECADVHGFELDHVSCQQFVLIRWFCLSGCFPVKTVHVLLHLIGCEAHLGDFKNLQVLEHFVQVNLNRLGVFRVFPNGIDVVQTKQDSAALHSLEGKQMDIGRQGSERVEGQMVVFDPRLQVVHSSEGQGGRIVVQQGQWALLSS